VYRWGKGSKHGRLRHSEVAWLPQSPHWSGKGKEKRFSCPRESQHRRKTSSHNTAVGGNTTQVLLSLLAALVPDGPSIRAECPRGAVLAPVSQSAGRGSEQACRVGGDGLGDGIGQ
jgi:hypothetical protein